MTRRQPYTREEFDMKIKNLSDLDALKRANGPPERLTYNSLESLLKEKGPKTYDELVEIMSSLNLYSYEICNVYTSGLYRGLKVIVKFEEGDLTVIIPRDEPIEIPRKYIKFIKSIGCRVKKEK